MEVSKFLKKHEAIGVWVTLITTIIGGSAFITTIDNRSKTNKENIVDIKEDMDGVNTEIDILRLEVNQIRSIDQRTLDMQEDLKIIKEHLINNK